MPNSIPNPLTRNRLVFIDPTVDDYHSLIAGVKPETDVLLLDPTEDGVLQIATALAGRSGIQSLHIVSHGSPGAIRLGKTKLSLDTLMQYRDQLQQWREALSINASILLYGCCVGATERGLAFIERFKSFVGAEIAASTNLTGSAVKGGDWELAVRTGDAAPLAFGQEVMESYSSVLVDFIPNYPSYRTVEKTYSDLFQLATDSPNLASWIDIGDSYDKVTPGGADGYDIYSLELTNKSVDVSGGKPTLYVQGALHARELTTSELVTRFGENLVANYGTNADSTWLLDYFKVVIVPVANPDGRKFAEQGYLWRKNANPNPPPGYEPAPFPRYGVDLNRNYDVKWGEIPNGSSGNPANNTYRGAAAFSEPETQAVSNYVKTLFPDQRGPNDTDPSPDDVTGLYLDIHSAGNLVLYPWGWTFDQAPNSQDLRTLGLKYGYFTGVDGDAYDVSPAVGLYPTDGASDDWTYATLGVPSYTVELGTQFFEESEYFENTIVPENLPALLYAAKSARRPFQTAAGPDSVDVSFDSSTLLLSAIADDTRYDDGIPEPGILPEPIQNILAGRYTIDTPSWISETPIYSLTAADGAFDSSVETLQALLDTTGLASGRHTIFVESQDAFGNWGVPSAVFITIPEPSLIGGLFAIAAWGAVVWKNKKKLRSRSNSVDS